MIEAVEALIDLALREDLGPHDITTKSLVKEKDRGVATVLAKEDFSAGRIKCLLPGVFSFR
jgi:Nicotinate-nucleotide pyrophosphorylase